MVRRARLSPTEEVNLTAAIIEALNLLPGCWARRNNTGKARGGRFQVGLGRGGADIICCVGGRFVALEVKREGGRTLPARAVDQAAWAAQVRAAGGTVVEVRSVQDALRAVRPADPWDGVVP